MLSNFIKIEYDKILVEYFDSSTTLFAFQNQDPILIRYYCEFFCPAALAHGTCS